MKPNTHLSKILSNLPNKPGVYQYYDDNGAIIYVGKAKVLKNRVRSYFNTQRNESAKTKILVKKIANIKYIITPTEYDALLLENTLIKKHKPKYNIQLKDDKTFPWICITKEPFPKIFSTRNINKKSKAEYIGPYSSVRVMKIALEVVKEIYPIRSCNLKLNEENIQAKKFKVCLDYHIKKCLGPCEAYQSEQEYNQSINQIRKILKGNIKEVIDYTKQKMIDYAGSQEYEKAQDLKEKLVLLENYQSKSTVVNSKINDVDVFSIISDVSQSFVNFLKIVNGSIVQSYTTAIKKKLDEEDHEILAAAIIELRDKFNSTSKTIYTSIQLEIDFGDDAKTFYPQIGDKKKLIEFSLSNVRQYKFERYKNLKVTNPEEHTNRVLSQIKKDLHLKELPTHIECFDNSNFQGTNAVAACVVFKNGKPSKKDYRHFNIKTVEGPNDFASMEEVVFRRYRRLKDENQSLPQLVIIDGGKGQLSSAVKALKDLDLFGKIAIVGIAKKLEEIFFPNDSIPLYIDKKSESLKTIQHLRNEAHRFGITHHRNKRSKNAINSELNLIPGIGEKTVLNLLKHFKSVKKIKEASEEELLQTVNIKQAKAILEHFKSN